MPAPKASLAGRKAAREMWNDLGLGLASAATLNAVGVMFDNFAVQRDRRVTELLEANNKLVDERRAAQRALREIIELANCVVVPTMNESSQALAFDRGAQKAFEKAAEIALAMLGAAPDQPQALREAA